MTIKGETPTWFGFRTQVRELHPKDAVALEGNKPEAATYVTMIVETPNKVRTGIHHVFSGGRETGNYEEEAINDARLTGPITIWDRLKGRGRERFRWEGNLTISSAPQTPESSSK